MGIHHGTIVISANLDGQLKAALGLTPSMNIIDSNQSGRLGHQRPLPSLLHPKPLPRIFAGLLASLEPSTSRRKKDDFVRAGYQELEVGQNLFSRMAHPPDTQFLVISPAMEEGLWTTVTLYAIN
ncbi:hypothetical protein PtB15_10B294 [Puccinia triticina]|nr:hypothetical protein PtB15_10B294 [Puccinia triticina]